MMDAMDAKMVVRTFLLLTLVVAGCSSSSGGGAGPGGGGGAGGQCGTQPPSAAPFNCFATYAEQLRANCEIQASFAYARAGMCDGFQVAAFTTGYLTIKCGYDTQGALVWAERCEDAAVWCGSFCNRSSSGPATLPGCVLPTACPGDAATD